MSKAVQALSTSRGPVSNRRAFVLSGAVAAAAAVIGVPSLAAASPSSSITEMRVAARRYRAAQKALEARDRAWLATAGAEQRLGATTSDDLWEIILRGGSQEDAARQMLGDLHAAWQSDPGFVEIYQEKDAAGETLERLSEEITDSPVRNLADLDELAECCDIAVNVYGEDEQFYFHRLLDAVRSVAGGPNA